MAIEVLLSEFGQLTLTNPFVVAVAVGIVRSIAGFLEITAKEWRNESRISRFSFKKLLETILRILPQELGLSVVGLPPGASFFTDWILKAAKKKSK